MLQQLVASLGDVPDNAPVFQGAKGSGVHQGRPLGAQGVRGVIRRLFALEGVREEIPDAIPYDLRDSFATLVGRAVRASGGRVGEAQDVARRLLGHGDGGDVLNRYWDDDERHTELAEYSPLRQLSAENGGAANRSGGAEAEIGGSVVEIWGLEPQTSALRTRRSPN